MKVSTRFQPQLFHTPGSSGSFCCHQLINTVISLNNNHFEWNKTADCSIHSIYASAKIVFAIPTSLSKNNASRCSAISADVAYLRLWGTTLVWLYHDVDGILTMLTELIFSCDNRTVWQTHCRAHFEASILSLKVNRLQFYCIFVTFWCMEYTFLKNDGCSGDACI